MKAALILLAGVSTAFAAPAAITVADVCAVPEKYGAFAADGGCGGAAAGYIVESFCKSGYEEDLTGLLTTTQTFTLSAATANAWSDAAPTKAVKGCLVPIPEKTMDPATDLLFAGTRIIAANGCAAFAGGGGNYANTAASSEIKGASIKCDMASYYYPTSGVEGSMFCQSSDTTNSIPWATQPPVPTNPYWQTGFGNEYNVADWDDVGADKTELTCSAACTIPEPLCYGAGVPHGNVMYDGPSLIDGACRMKPTNGAEASRLTFRCKSNPFTTYTARCNANVVNTVSNGLTWDGGLSPNCGGADGASTGFYTLAQNTPGTQGIDTIPGFAGVTSAIATVVTDAKGQWGGLQRQYEDFAQGSTYQVAVAGCEASGTRNDCVQKTINWWRCEGLTIDASAVCYANGVRIACPTHTNGHRCESSSKKGLLGLLGLIGIVPLLLLCLLCCCCLLPLLMRKKKTEGDVHFATFDPHAAPVAGSIAPATAYAPSIGAMGPVVGAAPMGVF